MSSTNTFGGYDQKRPTSKVLNPPGGKSNISLFGGGEQESPVKVASKNSQERNKSSLFAEEEPKAPKPSLKVAATPSVEPSSEKRPSEAAQVKSNAMAGEGAKKPSTRVVAPPGGASSGFAFG